MWNDIVKYLGKFQDAVLTGIDTEGYPFSIRCVPQVDEGRKVLHILLSGEVPIQPGPAGLLCHAHNDQMWNLEAFQILGHLDKNEQSWVLHPKRFIAGGGIRGPIDQMRALFKARADARKYLQKRTIPRPSVRWDEIKELQSEAGNTR